MMTLVTVIMRLMADNEVSNYFSDCHNVVSEYTYGEELSTVILRCK